jgi:dolichol-phosphate mannosyltransferase
MHGSTYDRELKNNIPMSIDKDQVCILIPTLNEAPTIGTLIRNFNELGFNNILVIDGHSTDATRQIAGAAGAKVVVQHGKGKGTAISEAFSLIDQPFILMIDGDGTYLPDDAEKMLNPLSAGADQVIGDRLTDENRSSFSGLNYAGNQILNRLFKIAHGRYLNDILSGYRAFTLESIRQMQLHESGFGIETEISAEAVRNRQDIHIVPIRYKKRSGTPTKLNPFHDGLKITTTIYRLAKMSNPLFYFGLIGIIIFCCGIITGTYVIYEWLQDIEHIPLTILTVLLVISGFQIFIFGVLSDMTLAFHREVMREIQSLRESQDQKK